MMEKRKKGVSRTEHMPSRSFAGTWGDSDKEKKEGTREECCGFTVVNLAVERGVRRGKRGGRGSSGSFYSLASSCYRKKGTEDACRKLKVSLSGLP